MSVGDPGSIPTDTRKVACFIYKAKDQCLFLVP